MFFFLLSGIPKISQAPSSLLTQRDHFVLLLSKGSNAKVGGHAGIWVATPEVSPWFGIVDNRRMVENPKKICTHNLMQHRRRRPDQKCSVDVCVSRSLPALPLSRTLHFTNAPNNARNSQSARRQLW